MTITALRRAVRPCHSPFRGDRIPRSCGSLYTRPLFRSLFLLIAGGYLFASPAQAQDVVSVDDVTVIEGNAGTTAVNFTVNRATNAAAFSVKWATANGTAVQPSDYVSANGILNFTAGGNLTESVTVMVNGDATPEPHETFLINLSALTVTSGTATLADAQGLGTITNDEPNAPPTGSIPGQSAAIGAPFSFTPAAFSDPEAGTLTYAATLSDDSPLPTWLSFNSTARQFTGTPTVAEIGMYAVKVTATDNGTPPLSGSATFNITVGYPVTVTTAAVTEGNGGSVTMTFTVTRTVADTEFSVNYAASGTAASGTDYVAVPNGTLTFAAGGALAQTIDVTVNGDTAIEANETIVLTLSGIVNATGITVVGGPPAAGVITNDDFVPSRFPATGALTSTLKGTIDLDAPPLTGGAEIPAFEPVSKRAFTSSNSGVQVIDLTDPGAPAFITTFAPASLGVAGLTSNDVSSVAIRKAAGANPAVLAAAVIASPKTAPGHIVFLNPATGALLGSAQVGANPDHIAFTPDGTKLLVALEGETAGNADLDPTAGGVAILNLAAGLAAPTVTTAGFSAWDAQAAALSAAGVRLFPGTLPSTDFEPEYFAIAPDGHSAMVTLQEANAVAILDIATATFTEIVPLGKKNFALGEYDFSDRDGAGAVALALPRSGQPVYGLYLPDAIAAYSSGGQTYYVTANEGDDRNDFLTPAETTTVGNAIYDLDDTVFPNEAALKNLASLGRLTVCNVPGLRGDTDNDGDIDEILSYGGRSFSILDSAGNIVFDSGDMLENIMASQFLSNFDDTRSDNKGPEPEGVTVVTIGSRVYAFLSLERSHMVVIFDVTSPAAVQFVGGLRRTGDMNPEGTVFVPPSDSPTGQALLLVANEVSQSLTIYELVDLVPAPEISVLDGAALLTDSQVTPVAFSPTMLLRNRARTLTIRNAGSSDLTGVTAHLDGPHAAFFAVTTAPAGTVAAGATTPLVITFTPPALGTYTANLHIHSNDGDEEPFDLVLTASAVPNTALASLTIGPDALLPAFTPDTTTLFSSYANGITSVTLTPTLMDPTATLAIRYNGTGAFAPWASGTTTGPFSLVEGSSRVELRVTGSDGVATLIYTVNLNRAPLAFTSANRDVFLPNTRESAATGVTLGGTQFINLGLQGVGRVPAGSIDPATGESLGSISDMQISGFVNNGDGSYSGTLTTLPDRGYNATVTPSPSAAPVNIFSNYAARTNNYSFTFTPYTAAAPTTAQDQIALTFTGSTRFTYDHDGNGGTAPVFTTGLLANGGTTLFGITVPVAAGASTQSDGTVIDRLTLDTEGLVLDTRPGKEGTGWIGDEYGAGIYHFSASREIDGVVKLPDALVPHAPVGTTNFLADPPINGRRINQGMEGLCQSPDGTLLFGMLQSATLQDSGSGNQGRTNARLVVYDLSGSDTPTDPIAQYVIQLPRFDADVALPTGTPGLDRAGAQSAIIALNNHQLLVLSRDGNGRGATGAPMFKSVLLVELTGATNFDGQFDGEGVNGDLTGSADILKPGITPVSWIEALNMLGKVDASMADLAKFSLNLNPAPGDINSLSEKWEALALVSCQDAANPNDYFLFVGNDNDFASATGRYMDAAGVIQSYDAGLENDTMVLAWRVRLNSLPDMRVHDGVSTSAPFIADGLSAPVAAGITNPVTSISRSYTIHNSGNAPLTLSDPPVTISGPHAGEFVLTSPPGLTSLPVGATTTFTLQFTPAATGARTATLSIGSNAPGDKALYEFPLRGFGNTPPAVPPQNYIRGAGLPLKIKLSTLLGACTDAEAGTLSLTSTGASAQGALITSSATHLIYTPANDSNDSFTYTVSDGQGGSAGNTITVQVIPQTGAVTGATLAPGGAVTAGFAGIPGLSYTVERSTDLMTWLPFSTVTVPANGLFSITDNDGLPSAFYRLRYNP